MESDWKENSFLLLYFVILCTAFYKCLPVFYVFVTIWMSYSSWMYFYANYGWKNIGRIKYIYSINEEETKKHFVAYIQDEYGTNKVIQHIYGSIDEKLLESHIEKYFVEAIDEDGSVIELNSCDQLICDHVRIMLQSASTWSPQWDENELFLGITKQDWVAINDKVWRTSLVMLDMKNVERDIYSRQRHPRDNHIIGRSCTWEVDLKIQEEIYCDVNICMQIYEDAIKPLYESFWMYGIYCDLKLVKDGKIAMANDVSVRYRKRKKNLLKY